MELNVSIIGLGGVGSSLVKLLSRYINYSKDIRCRMLLIDGDSYEPKNLERQEFTQMGNKAECQERELSSKFKNILFNSIPEYINEGNINHIIQDNSVIFICVDNHKTRMIINNYCKTLNDVTVISGGNEFTDGNAQLFVKKGGKELTPDICAYHPEIANPEDKLPEEMSCEELAHSQPQLLFTNVGVATFMCFLFYNSVINQKYDRSEVYFDMLTMNSNSKIRTVK